MNIVGELAWRGDSPVIEVIRAEEAKGELIMQPFNLFFKRVLHLSAYRISELCEMLGLREDFKEKIWEVMKAALSVETHLLMNRHLDQIIMCTIYGVCKAMGVQQLTFNSIIGKYNELYKQQKNLQNVFMQVSMPDGAKKDIIAFYNELFIQHMKEYIISSKLVDGTRTPHLTLTPSANKPLIKQLCPPSPLKQNLPPNIMQFN
eukprot:CAMPEP_0202957916 /NCGR_PEP_ID=MMETSP1396-20130829/2285_1 /ASSEMBLY_ACC=CAM_ASM_000872 /TAXON_ID= /ORGANISM="Pseudokeronopsis sp., Strain Brazil" /LENGTH=203 /DNA_ID=CAMNT_0049675655 /DNA_START=1727 /DNA_END=2338 /DNA_ORIENTATION=-